MLVVRSVLLTMMFTVTASAQSLPSGWSITARAGISGPEALACSGSRAAMRDWFGSVAVWDGSSWSTLPRRQEGMYGRTLAITGDRIFLESGGGVAIWDGSAWTDVHLSGWQGDVGAQVAASGGDAYLVGWGRIARVTGNTGQVFAAGTWRSLRAIAIAGDRIWIGGQGGTIMRRDAGTEWVREATGIETWVRSIVANAPDDAWALADGASYDQSSVLHFDGRAWSRRDAGLTGAINALGGSSQAFYATGDAGLWRWDGAAWSLEIAQGDLGSDSRRYGLHGVCTTDRHVIVGFGPHALIRAR